MNNGIPLVVLTGPTAVGKTNLSIKLAKAIGAEIISADSMQVYKRMNIGTAKITKEEMQSVPHYMIDILEPEEEFNVVMFQEYAKRYIAEIISRGHIPLITGGTGFYIQALLKDVSFTEQETDYRLRNELEQYARVHGNDALYKRLQEIDPEYAESVHSNNIKRIIRAIEYYEQTGEKFSVHNSREALRQSPYNYAYFVLNDNRDVLYERIDNRVDNMMDAGLVNEVKSLMAEGCTPDMVSMQGLGYKEIIAYLNNQYDYEYAVALLKKMTRHFARRQLTWFKRENDTIWYNKSELSEEAILNKMISQLQEKNIII